ncbi:MAG: DUF3566 domain-containing protein [Nocardioidaceae bacterium]|nr:DUF3566 domain-containing protein [Nocardioidaceae bacterium]
MTDRKPQASAPTSPQQSQPRGAQPPQAPPQRPQPSGSNGSGPTGAQPRGGATPASGSNGTTNGTANGTGRPSAPRAPGAGDPPTEQIPAVRPGTDQGTAEKAPADASSRPSESTSKVATAGSIAAESDAPDRTQAIPVVREPLREKTPSTTGSPAPTSSDPAPTSDDDATGEKETAASRRRRKRELAAAEAAEAEAEPVSTRKARLRLVRLDPWSVMKTAFALSISLAIVTIVAVTLVWAVLDLAGVWDAINSSVATILSDNADAFDVTDYVGFGRIIGFTLLIAAVNVVLLTALATIGAFLYNLSASLLGGLEVTLAEDH